LGNAGWGGGGERGFGVGGGKHLRGPLEGVGPENRDFLGPEMATSEASAIWALIQKILCHSPVNIVLDTDNA
jgi:hypothetical protein